MQEDSIVHAYLKQHAHALVKQALTEYPTLADCVAVLSLPDGPPRLVARATAKETLEEEGYPRFLFEIDLGDVPDADDLVIAGKIDGIPFVDTLQLGRGDRDENPKRLGLPPFPRGPLNAKLLDRMANTIASLQRQVYDGICRVGHEPGAFFIFWSLFEESPVLLVREGAKAVLGSHAKWKQMLPHLYTPCDDVLVLVDVGNDELTSFVRTDFLANQAKAAN